jgi:hypothetical protein
MAALCLFDTCSNDTLFNADKKQWSVPFAFVTDSNLTITLADSANPDLLKNINVFKNQDVHFIGLISNSRANSGIGGKWNYGDGNFDSIAIDSIFIATHAFADTGSFHGLFTITDAIGDVAADSVIIHVKNPDTVKTIAIELLSPSNNRINVDPAETGGVLFSWKITKSYSYDTVTSNLYLGESLLSMNALATMMDSTHIDITTLRYDTKYFWRVVIKRDSGVVCLSDIDSFSTKNNSATKGPQILSIRSDTTVNVKDTLAFFATVTDSVAKITEYAWDFESKGVYEYKDSLTASCKYAFADTGSYKSVFRVTDKNSQAAFDTVKINVVQANVVTGKGPVIKNIMNDTTITVLDSLLFFATVTDSVAKITEYAWDFEGSGAYGYSSSVSASCKHAYSKAGVYKAVFRATDADSKVILDTVIVTVVKIKLHINYISPDTIVEYGASVRCSVAVNNKIDSLRFEIDTIDRGHFVLMNKSGYGAGYLFKIDTAAIIDSVKIRVYAPLSDTLLTGFKVSVRPRTITISTIDSTDSTITVNWTKTLESSFAEYRIYRNSTSTVDTTVGLWATVTQAGITSYTSTPASYSFLPRYYRIYQKDNNGLLSPGSNVVYGNIRNSSPVKPVFVNPTRSNDSVWSNTVVQWNKSPDPNGDTVKYSLYLNRNNAGYVAYANGITDTFVKLTGFDSMSFGASIMIKATDSHGRSDSSELNNIFFKQIRNGDMIVVSKGTFTDSLGNSATISYDFFMDSTEVTQLMYKTVMNGNNPSNSINDKQPVENITWYQAIMYCNAASKKLNLDTAYTFSSISSMSATGLLCNLSKKAVRLPTEDEWELAAHGGKGFTYATNDGALSCAKANYGTCGISSPAIYGSYPANPYNLYEMTGNVAEFCWDVYSTSTIGNKRIDGRVDYSDSSTSSSMFGFSTHVKRGGDFNETNTGALRVDSRTGVNPYTASSRVGFRCVIPNKQ